jgi:DNA ligase-1
MTGAFRSPVSGPTVAGAIARIAQSRAEAVTWLLDQAWSPTPGAWARLLRAAPDVDPGVLPRRFTACQAVDESTSTRTHPDEWWMEWMLGGTPAQIIRTRDAVQLWSATGELLTARHPDLVSQALSLPVGTVVEGHLMDDSGATPAQPRHRFVASDLLADPDPNVAAMTFEGRRQVLSRRVNALASGRDLLWPPSTSGDRGQAELFEVPALASPALVTVSDRFVAGAWDQVRHYHQQSRQHAARGLRLRRLTSCGAEDGWGEWQAPPMASRVVLLSVEMSPDSRELSPEGWVVGLRHGPKLVTVGRARLELPAGERLELEAWVRSNRAGRFGPVRAVRAEVVLGLEFDDVRRSSRHRAGLVFQGARVVRWVKNATPEEADDLAGFVATLQARSAHESG